MPVDFGQLLDGQRLRSLWGRDAAPAKPDDKPAGPPRTAAAVDDEQEAAGSHLAIESPGAVMRVLETALSAHAGPAAGLVAHILLPLRAGISRLDPTAGPVPAHPLLRASPLALTGLGEAHDRTNRASGVNVQSVQGMQSLIDQLDDILGALLRQPR